MITFEEVKKNDAICTYISQADESLVALGYTEHSFAHVTHVAETAGYILTMLGYGKHEIELMLTLDKHYGSIMDYFEIFLQRMILCRKAAERLGLEFRLLINGEIVI